MNTKNSQNKPLTVTQISNNIKYAISNNLPNMVHVVGEISSAKLSGNHMYISIKDINSVLNIVSWNHERNFPDDNINKGDNVIVSGNSEYQVVKHISHLNGLFGNSGRFKLAIKSTKMCPNAAYPKSSNSIICYLRFYILF